jgi:hypothetical protein
MGRLYNEHLWGNDCPVYGREAYRKHNEEVRAEAREADRELLEYDVSQGWAPLCKFLGKTVPEGVSFPRVDDWKEYKARVKEEESGEKEEKREKEYQRRPEKAKRVVLSSELQGVARIVKHHRNTT